MPKEPIDNEPFDNKLDDNGLKKIDYHIRSAEITRIYSLLDDYINLGWTSTLFPNIGYIDNLLEPAEVHIKKVDLLPWTCKSEHSLLALPRFYNLTEAVDNMRGNTFDIIVRLVPYIPASYYYCKNCAIIYALTNSLSGVKETKSARDFHKNSSDGADAKTGRDKFKFLGDILDKISKFE